MTIMQAICLAPNYFRIEKLRSHTAGNDTQSGRTACNRDIMVSGGSFARGRERKRSEYSLPECETKRLLNS